MVGYRPLLTALLQYANLEKKRKLEAEMHPAVVSGIVTKDVPVSYRPIFFPVCSSSPRSEVKCPSGELILGFK